ncbi:MAG: hypothetical protein ACK559_07375, partial [bacterium]
MLAHHRRLLAKHLLDVLGGRFVVVEAGDEVAVRVFRADVREAVRARPRLEGRRRGELVLGRRLLGGQRRLEVVDRLLRQPVAFQRVQRLLLELRDSHVVEARQALLQARLRLLRGGHRCGGDLAARHLRAEHAADDAEVLVDGAVQIAEGAERLLGALPTHDSRVLRRSRRATCFAEALPELRLADLVDVGDVDVCRLKCARERRRERRTTDVGVAEQGALGQ